MKVCFINDGANTFAVFERWNGETLVSRNMDGQPRAITLDYLRTMAGRSDDAPAADVARLTAEIARETSESLEPLTPSQFLEFVDAPNKTRQYAVIVHIRAIDAGEAMERVGTALLGRGYTWEIIPTETKQE